MTEAMVDDALVEVTPEDRVIAASVLPPIVQAEVIAGKHDMTGNCSAVVQAFARHRLAGVAAGREEAVTYLRESAAKFRAEAVRQGKRPGPLARSFDDAASAIEEDTAIRQRGE